MAFLEVQHLKKYFDVGAGVNHAVDDVTFNIEKGHTMGVVGESGCGKSTLGRTIIRLLDATDGHVIMDGEDITYAKDRDLRRLREKMSIVFQDPYSSLNPRICVQDTIREPLQEARRFSKAEIADRTEELMDLVGIEERLRMAYPHEMDGGRRQRVGDLSVVRHISDDICVMYLGQLVETCPSRKLFVQPLHPYTKALLSAIPSTDIDHPMKRVQLKGEITSAINPKPGCRFAPRCPYATEACKEPQQLIEAEPGHFVSCCRVKEIN